MKVTVAEWLDGSIHILYEKKEIAYEEITQQVLQRVRKGERLTFTPNLFQSPSQMMKA
jgi:hypothetical protein